MESMPTISVLMCVYDEDDKYIQESIESILFQTYRNFEFIIIGDNPGCERVVSLVKSYQAKDERIKYYQNTYNIGLTKSLNKGLALCNGKYIARMDADDISMPRRLEMQVKLFESESDIDVVFGHVYDFTENDIKNKRLRKLPLDTLEIVNTIFYSNKLVHPVAMLRKSTLEEKNICYDPTMRRSQDYDLWLTMLMKNCKFRTVDETLLFYRLSDRQISRKNLSEQQADAFSVRVKCLKNYFRDFGFDYRGEISIGDIHHLYRSVVKKKEWGCVDRQLFLMLYYTMPDTICKMADASTFGLFRCRFNFRQLLYLLRKPFIKNPSIDIKDLLNEISIH